MNYFEKTKRRWANAQAVVKQLKAGEWQFQYNPYSKECLAAIRGDKKLWVGNGGWFCDTRDIDSHTQQHNAFGYILRHYVYWFGVFLVKRKADKKLYNQCNPLPDLTK